MNISGFSFWYPMLRSLIIFAGLVEFVTVNMLAGIFGSPIHFDTEGLDTGSHGISEMISIAVVIGLHLWKRQMLVSITAGTVCYMLLEQFVF